MPEQQPEHNPSGYNPLEYELLLSPIGPAYYIERELMYQ
jgi:hypothetical protein